MKPFIRLLIAAALVWATAAAGQGFDEVAQSSNAVHFDPSSGNLLLGTGLAWGDFDGDADLDLYVTNWATNASFPTNALLANQGDGSFVEVAPQWGVDEPGNSVAAAWSDFDNDGDLDLYVADFFDQDQLYENLGEVFATGAASGTVNLVRLGNVTSVSWGDFDNDGWSDFYLGKFYHANQLYRNLGDGTFAIADDLGVNDKRDTKDVRWVDYDNDGDLDLYALNREQENALYRNEAGGAFTEVACALTLASKEIGQGQAWGDFDNDGDLDLFLANIGGNNLYRNDGFEDFVDVAEAAGVRLAGFSWLAAAAAWGDFDADGWLDLYVATGADRDLQADVLLGNNRDGTFREATAEAGLGDVSSHVAAAWGDYDGDGAPDLYVVDGLGPFGGNLNPLYRNRTPGQSFIKVTLQGKGPAAGGAAIDAYGARIGLVDIASGTLAGFRQVLSGSDAAEQVFGAPAGPYDVVVFFPNTAEPVVVRDVAAGSQLTIVEP